MKAEDVREIAAVEAWCISRGDFERATAEWPNMLAIDKEHYYALADGIIAAVAPLIAAAEREAIAVWHDEWADGEKALSVLAERDGDREGTRLHQHLASEHRASAAAIRSRTGDK